MDRRGLERRIAEGNVETRLLEAPGALAQKTVTINAIAAEHGKREKQIRDSFDDLFKVTGRDRGSNETIESTPRFKLLPASDSHGVVTAEISRMTMADGAVQVRFFENGYRRADETYDSTVVTRHADSGESFAEWASKASSPTGTVSLLQESQTIQEHAEDTLALLWGALSDPDLNPNFAPRAIAMLAAAETTAEVVAEAATQEVAEQPVQAPAQESVPPAQLAGE